MPTPTHFSFTRAELEARRLQAAEDLSHGSSQFTISRRYHVSRTTAWRWQRAIRNHQPLTSTHAPGRPARLLPQQLEMLKALCGDRSWTGTELQKLIRDVFQVSYHRDHCYRLMAKLGIARKQARSSSNGNF